MSLTNTTANALLDLVLGTPSGSGGLWPSTVYVGLLTAAPNNDGSGVVEVAGGSYARRSRTNSLAEWPAASSRAKTHANDITFPQATDDWGTVTHFGIFDASSGGSLLGFGTLDAPAVVNNGDQFRFLVGTSPLTLSIP